MGSVLSTICTSSLIILVSYPHRNTAQSTSICDEAYECANQTIGNLDASGYQSASGTSTTIRCLNTDCDCNGAFSCYNTQSIAFEEKMSCDGIHSCSNHHPQKGYITNYQTGGRMWCGGANSCSSTVIQETTGTITLLCTGFLSCANSYISGIFETYARGAFSLYNSTIDSNGTNTNITLKGYSAGFHSQILCRPTDVCNIYCPQSGCDALHINCTGNCIFNDFNQQNQYNITRDIDPLFHYLKSITAQNDDQCNNQSVSTAFDGINTPFTNENINGSHRICCRGSSLCKDKTIEHISAGQQLIANAQYSFRSSSLSVIGDIFCSGSSSCRDSLINRVKGSSYCVGSSSCREITINQSEGNISCFGYKSCLLSTIYTSGNGNTHCFYLLGSHSAQDATFYCKETDECVVICAGFDSCLGTSLLCAGHCNVQCNEYSACPIVQSSNASRSPTAFPSTSNAFVYPTIFPSVSTSHPTFSPLTTTNNPPLTTSSSNPSAPLSSTMFPYVASFNPTRNPLASNPSVYPTIFPSVITSNPTFSSPETTKHPTITPIGSTSAASLNPFIHSTDPLSEGGVSDDFVSTIKDTDDEDNIDEDKIDEDNSWIWYFIDSAALSAVACCVVCICILFRKQFRKMSEVKRTIETLSQVQAPPVVIQYDATHVVEVDKARNVNEGEPNLELIAGENVRGEGSVCGHQAPMVVHNTAGIIHAQRMALSTNKGPKNEAQANDVVGNKVTSAGCDNVDGTDGAEYNNPNIAADEFIVQ